MSTETDSLIDALQARLGEHAAALAVDVFAAWAAGTADMIAAGGCLCPEDHAAHAAHFRHIAMVLRNVYDAKPLTEDTETPIVLPQPAELGLTWEDGSDLLVLTSDGICLYPAVIDERLMSPAEAREMAAHLAAMADAYEAAQSSTGEADTR